MRKKHICKKVNTYRRSVSMHITEGLNFESDLECRIQSLKPYSLEFGSINLERPIFKLKL